MNVFLGVIFGVLGGVIAGMGMGGGTLLIPLLVIFLSFDQLQAQTINLLAFLPMALASLIIHFKNHLVDFKSTWVIALFGMLGAIFGAYATTLVDTKTLKICFGAFLIILGTYQFSKRIYKSKYKYYKD